MEDQQDPRSKQFEQARSAFEDLRIEDRALFLVQETIATVAHGIEQAGRTLATEIDALFREVEEEIDEMMREAEEAEQEATSPPLDPETTARTATRKKPMGTKKTTKQTPPPGDTTP